MPSTPARPQPAPMMQALVLWGALLASQGMIVLISQTAMTGQLTGGGLGATPTAPDQTAQVPASIAGHLPEWIFFAMAGVSLLLAYFVPRLLLKNAKPVFGHDGQVTRESMQRILRAWIARWALLESVTLFGFVNSMLNANPPAIYPFAGASLIGFILAFPSERKLRAGSGTFD